MREGVREGVRETMAEREAGREAGTVITSLRMSSAMLQPYESRLQPYVSRQGDCDLAQDVVGHVELVLSDEAVEQLERRLEW